MRQNYPKWLIIHHEAGSNGFEAVNKMHRNNPKVWLGELSSLGFAIAYHYYITDKGKIIQARASGDEGAHTRGMNTSSIGICLQGNFSKDEPTYVQKEALRDLIAELMKRHNIPLRRVVPHRFFNKTECYGTKLSNEWAKNLVDIIDIKPKDVKQMKLLKDKIGILEKLIQIYIQLLELIKGRNQ